MSHVVEEQKTALERQGPLDMIPKEYEEILKAAVSPIYYQSLEGLIKILSRGVLLDEGTTWFYLNDRGQHCELISIKHCIIQDKPEGDYRYVYNSRFIMGSYVSYDCKFKTYVRAQFLTPDITYKVNLVFKFRDEKNMSKPPNIRLEYILEGETTPSFSYLADKRELDDRWMVELCHFTSEQETSTANLQITFKGTMHMPLEVEGIEFLPVELDKAGHHVSEEIKPILSDDSDTYCEQIVPSDFRDIIKLSIDRLQWTTEKELYSILSKGLLINNGEEWFSLDKNGKKCLMLSTRAVFSPYEQYLEWRSLPESRFEETIEFHYAHPDIVTKIKSHLLESETRYATYLVYKLPQDQYCFEALVEVTDVKDNSWYVILVTPQTPVIVIGKVEQNTRNPVRRPDLKGFPKQRSDGWMEVQVWEFQTPSTNEIIPMHLKLKMNTYQPFRGLVFQGIEFRPI